MRPKAGISVCKVISVNLHGLKKRFSHKLHTARTSKQIFASDSRTKPHSPPIPSICGLQQVPFHWVKSQNAELHETSFKVPDVAELSGYNDPKFSTVFSSEKPASLRTNIGLCIVSRNRQRGV